MIPTLCQLITLPLCPTPPRRPTLCPQDTGFDPLEFWIRYKSKIVLYGALLAVALVIFGLYKWNEDRTKAASEAAFSSAKTAEDFRKSQSPRAIRGRWRGANAQMMLAERLRTDGKLDESIAASRSLPRAACGSPAHRMISLDQPGLMTLEAKADFAEDPSRPIRK